MSDKWDVWQVGYLTIGMSDKWPKNIFSIHFSDTVSGDVWVVVCLRGGMSDNCADPMGAEGGATHTALVFSDNKSYKLELENQ